jgi:oligopeptide/dipeptide ABC transporter ATP-binding protein
VSGPLLEVRDLKVHFPVRGGLLLRARAWNRAVDGVDLELHARETLGLVGESGCGKSTLGKALLRLLEPTAGSIRFGGEELTTLSRRAMKPLRPRIQMVFQDPADSLNPRHRVREILEEPLVIHRRGDAAERARRVRRLLDLVGLPADAADRYPFEFSGGQRQRIGIARAVALDPELVVCDEPVSALDVSIQSQILNLLLDLQEELGLAYLFVAHDLAVVKHVSDRIAVMYLGRIVETGHAEPLYGRPAHPYTRALLEAVPIPEVPDPTRRPERRILAGEVPSPVSPPAGCAFHTRCPHAEARCRQERPELREIGRHEGVPHRVACHFDL